MNPFIIPAVMSIFGGIMGYQAGKDAEKLGKEQEMLAEQNARLEKRELDEEVRRQREEDQRLRSSALARAAASGAKVDSGSSMESLLHLEKEQKRQLDWTQSAGASRIRLNLDAAKLDAKTTRLRAKTQQREAIFGGLSSAFGYLNQGGIFGTGGWDFGSTKTYSNPGRPHW